jgi:hypothetical protein
VTTLTFLLSLVDNGVNKAPMKLFRPLRQNIARLRVGRAVARSALLGAALLAAGTFSGTVLAAPQDVCLPIVGCITTTVPTVTLPTTVTVPTLPITTTTTTTTTVATGGSTTSAGSGGGSTGPSTPTSTATTTTATDATATRGVGLSVKITVRVRGHGAKRAIELRLRLSKPARVNALLSRKGKALKRQQFTARAGSSVWRLRIRRTVKPGAAKLGVMYRSSAGEIARSSHRLCLPR